MWEKGGKGYSAPKTPKSALNTSQAPSKGKDEGSAKSKRGRKVQFDNEDLGRAGKGGKTMGEGKSAALKERSKPELKIEDELPKNAKCLMNSGAADILQGIQEQMIGLQYAKRSNHYTDPQSLRRVLENLTKHGASDGEICMIANICPETVDEVFALVPSLKRKESKLKEPLKNAVSELVQLRNST